MIVTKSSIFLIFGATTTSKGFPTPAVMLVWGFYKKRIVNHIWK